MLPRACVFVLFGVALATQTRYELKGYESTASSDAIVLSSDSIARFTVLTASIIRMEYSTSKQFEDRPSLAFLNRNLPVPPFTAKEQSGTLTIETSQIRLTYKVGQPFVSSSLFVESINTSSAFTKWTAGMTSASDPGNLLGTFRTLDGEGNRPLNCTTNGREHCELGIISRSGWALIDDAKTPLLDDDDWWTQDNGELYPRKSSVDWYLFCHGHAYTLALEEYSKIGGSIPMVPRYISGIWFTRWYAYNGVDTRKVVLDYASRSIPLDVWVYDMNWHQKNSWTGYTVDPALFPFPEQTWGWLKSKGLAVSGNLHDAEGVNSFEAQFEALRAALGEPNTTTVIPLRLNNKTSINALEDLVLLPLEKLGFDFWWIDWQQGEAGFGTRGGKMNPTIWTDKIRVTDPKRRHVQKGGSPSDAIERGVVFARFGGLGNHRYQVGFSGDVDALTWTNLAYQPYFTSTAANVLYGHWSHDIEGPGDDAEMYVRWIQWGSYSPVMRSHDRGMSSGGCYSFPTVEGSCPIVEPYNVPRRFFEANRDALQQRASLLPYIYTQMRQAYETGISIVRPLYYEYPEDPKVYTGDEFGTFNEYMFGDDILVAPVTVPGGANTLANVTVYLPQGAWVERHSGTLYQSSAGGLSLNKAFDLTEIPIFVKAGAVIVEKPCCEQLLGGAMTQYTTLIFSIFPGVDSHSGRIYEDDGHTTAYLNGEFAWTQLNYSRSRQSPGGPEVLQIQISTTGTYDALPQSRRVVVKVVNSFIPDLITVGPRRRPLPRSAFETQAGESWNYDGNELTLVVDLGVISVAQGATVSISYPAPPPHSLSGVRGLIAHAVLAKRNLDEVRATPGSQSVSGAELERLAMLGDALSHLSSDSSAFENLIANLSNAVNATVSELAALVPPPEAALVQLWSDSRGDHCLCGSEACRDTNSGYQLQRVEGFMAPQSHPFAVKLRDYWNGINDNYATTDAAAPPGYTPATFQNGWVLNAIDGSKEDNVAPLAVYVLDFDHLTVATPEGHAYAKQHNYSLVNGTVGYVFVSQPTSGLGNVNAVRLDYSASLINIAVEQWSHGTTHSYPTIPHVQKPKPNTRKAATKSGAGSGNVLRPGGQK